MIISVKTYEECLYDEISWGGCRNCGHLQDGCEMDARNYRCEECDMKQVFGLAELAIMGELTIKED